MHDHAAQRDLLSLQAVPQRPTVRGLVRQRVHPLMVGEQSLVPNAVEAAWRHLQGEHRMNSSVVSVISQVARRGFAACLKFSAMNHSR